MRAEVRRRHHLLTERTEGFRLIESERSCASKKTACGALLLRLLLLSWLPKATEGTLLLLRLLLLLLLAECTSSAEDRGPRVRGRASGLAKPAKRIAGGRRWSGRIGATERTKDGIRGLRGRRWRSGLAE